MKKDWTYKKLGEVCDLYQPKTISAKELVEDGMYPVYGANGIIGKYDKYNHENSELLMTCRGATCGTINVSVPYSWINGNAMVIHPKSDIVSIPFLAYQLKGIDLSDVITGAAQPQITRQTLTNKVISIPSSSSQQQIVAELDLLSGMIEKQKAQIEELDKLSQSIFYDMFGDPVTNEKGWEVKKMIEIYKFIDYRGKTPHKIESGVPLITARNIRKGEIDYSIAEFISEDEFAQRQTRGVAKKGDILFTTEAPMGFAAIADKEVFSTGQRLITFQAKNIDVINNQFALFYILSDVFQNELNRQATGSTVKGIKGSRLENFTIQIPPFSLQQEFAAKIEAIEAMKAKVRQSLKESETLFNSRMDYYFN